MLSRGRPSLVHRGFTMTNQAPRYRELFDCSPDMLSAVSSFSVLSVLSVVFLRVTGLTERSTWTSARGSLLLDLDAARADVAFFHALDPPFELLDALGRQRRLGCAQAHRIHG